MLELLAAFFQLVAFVDKVTTVSVVVGIFAVLLTAAGVIGLIRARRESSC